MVTHVRNSSFTETSRERSGPLGGGWSDWKWRMGSQKPQELAVGDQHCQGLAGQVLSQLMSVVDLCSTEVDA